MDKIIILAAGASSRFWPLSQNSHKAFYKCGLNKTIIEETVFPLLNFAKEIDVVVSPKDLGLAKTLFTHKNIKIFLQKDPNGEGDALLQVFSDSNFSGKFFLTTAEKINAVKILDLLKKEKEAIALRETDTPELFGIVELNKDSYITSVTEKPKKPASNFKITSGYLLDAKFINVLKGFSGEHYSLEAALDTYVKDNKVKGVFVDSIEDITLKFPWDLLSLNKAIQNQKDFKFIEKSAQIAKTVVIEGSVYIGKNAKIFDFVKIKGPVYIGENAVVGDHSLVRDNVFLDKNVVVGAGSEVKNSILYQGASLHRNYIGDSIIDKNVKIGAGTVFANRRNDREKVKTLVKGEKMSTTLTSLGAIVGQGSRIGINSSVMPGVKIGSGVHIWPQSLVLKDVADNEVFKAQ